jgi:protein TonB
MATLRPTLTHGHESRDIKSALSLLILMFGISAWAHLVGFSIWEPLDLKARDRFYFEMADASPPPPVLELTLLMNEPEAPADTPAGDAPGAAPPETAETAEAALPGGDQTAPQTDPEAPQALDPDLARAELLPPGEGQGAPNPDPPVVLEAEAPKFKSYYTLIRSAVARHWIMSPEARAQFRPSRLTVDFTIGRDGAFLRLVVVQSTGSPSLDHAGLEAIRSAAPFPSFPEELRQYSQLDIRMHFDYQAQYIKRPRE